MIGMAHFDKTKVLLEKIMGFLSVGTFAVQLRIEVTNAVVILVTCPVNNVISFYHHRSGISYRNKPWLFRVMLFSVPRFRCLHC